MAESAQALDELARELQVKIVEARALAGGSICTAWSLRLADGRRVFAKTHADAAPDMFEVEARGLASLRAAQSLRVPEVLHASARWLVLELLEPGPRRADFDVQLGRGLALLHRAAGPRFGLDHDNYIGTQPQPNGERDEWPSFYRDLRLRPMLARARRKGTMPARLERRFERLFARLETLCGPPEPPARLHGDLWAGNLHCDAEGAPVLIDPAVYFGHREIDLAMMRLFGGFGPRSFAAYAEAWPLAPGWEQRVHLYQLYPLLVHVVLFGASYLGAVETALAQLE